ncbi:MAG: hypothetical protein ACRDL7_03200 [Gaiellaceae bacterium]
MPRLLFKQAETTQQQQAAAPSSLLSQWWQQVQGRTQRLHGTSVQWARTWSGISAAFGCFRVTAKVLRNGQEDEVDHHFDQHGS